MITFDPVQRIGILEIYFEGQQLKTEFDWRTHLLDSTYIDKVKYELIKRHSPRYQEQEYESNIYY